MMAGVLALTAVSDNGFSRWLLATIGLTEAWTLVVITAILVEGQSGEAAVEKGKWLSAGPELLTENGEWEGGHVGETEAGA